LSRPVGLYVHIPFCEAKCSYCHFAIDPRRPDSPRQERYLGALLTEMRTAEAVAADTLYFGGGTPSLMSPSRLRLLVDEARSRFGLPAAAEVTVEVNPGDLDAAGYRELAALGANRVSLGAQSFDDRVLGEMGRQHTAADSRRAVDRAREAGFDNVSVDLILGWPGETRERWEQALGSLLRLSPEHVSLYILEVTGRNVLAHRQRTGRLALPDDDLVADLYQDTVDRLGAAGVARYEISNFARTGFESRHNRKYWDESAFLGFGMAAHSLRDGRRWWNLDRYATYCAAVEAGRSPVGGERALSALEQAQEALFTGLRRSEGVDLSAFLESHGMDPREEWAEPLGAVSRAGLVEERGGRLRLTDRGMLLSNEVFGIFV
jgi:oxygen-independent coproporphyrinogen-3 oxidase